MLTAQIAAIVPFTEAEGPGRRFALWFQGCPLRCPGCCNPEYLPFTGGTTRAVDDLCREIERSREQNGIEGITLLGGEPFAHAEPAAALAVAAHRLGLSVMIFSGFTLEHLRTTIDPHTATLLAHTDILVDGPYLREQPDAARRWIGSTNHRFDESWRQRNTLEIRVRGSEVLVNGFPSGGAVGLWKGWKRKARTGTTDGSN
jgi:anaerobic ribonucleoside-triphosphate reductase activating protein